MKLMIVEDNDRMREMIKMLFGSKFDEFVECSDGKEAVDTYKKSLPDWVFMDIKMREVDGITATKQIKQLFPDAKIVIVTDYGDETLRKEARLAGAREYVLKENLYEIDKIINQ